MSIDPNIGVLELVVQALGPLRDELVLVGGCSVGLLITDAAHPPVRETKDVDMVAQVVTLNDHYETCERLRKQGFAEAADDDNMCRWRRGALILDVLPSQEGVLGHSTNRWYPDVVATATSMALPRGLVVRILTAPLFVATKFEAFHGRGEGDYLSHDIEDIVNVVDGRPELAGEVAHAPVAVQDYLLDEFERLVTDGAFIDILPAHFRTDSASQRRVAIVFDRMRRLAGY